MPKQTKGAILVAARAHFLELGVADASLDAIRRDAGASNGSFFHHFPTKTHLALALYLAALSSYQASLVAAVADQPRARAGVEKLIDAHVTWVFANPDDARVLADLKEAATIEGAPIDWAVVNHEAFTRLQTWIQRGVDRGELQPLPFLVWLSLVFGPAMMLTSTWALQAEKALAPAVRRALAAAAWAGVKKQS